VNPIWFVPMWAILVLIIWMLIYSHGQRENGA
jgi:hypothetical protein